MAKKREKRPAFEVPRDLAGASELVRQIGELERQIEVIELDASEQVELIKAESAKMVGDFENEIAAKVDALNAYAAANRESLTEDGKAKTVVVPSGTFGWRKDPDSVKVEDEELAISELEMARLGRFIRRKPSIDKEAILKDPAKIAYLKHISIAEGRENFWVKPSETQLELVKGVRKLKRQKN